MGQRNFNEHKREFTGTVVSARMNKTVVARVDTMKMNQKYQKAKRVSRQYQVHDEKGLAKAGSVVKFVECRPLSKTKRWRLLEVVKSS